jgi:dipeptidase E
MKREQLAGAISYERIEKTKQHCLGLLPGSFCPHYHGEKGGRDAYQRLLLRGDIQQGVAIDDSAALHFVNGKLVKAVSSRIDAKAYCVRRTNQGIEEIEIKTIYLEREEGLV